MSEFNLEAVESIRIVRADGNLTVTGANAPSLKIESGVAPEINREGAAAEIRLRSNAEVRVPAGVAIEITDCAGNLDIEDIATPAVIGRVAGNLRARRMSAIVIRDTVAGNARFENIGALRGRAIGGRLLAEDAAEIEMEMVAGKVRISDIERSVRIGIVNGRMFAHGVGGDVSVGAVSGHVSISKVGGALDLPDARAALELRGPFPAGKTWRVRGRGRIAIEVDADASLEVSVTAGRGRVRIDELDSAALRWTGRGCVTGTLGVERSEAERTRLEVETHDADVLIARAGSGDRDWCASGRDWRRGRPGPFDELGDIIREEFGGEIPKLVSSILGATGRFVARGGGWSERVVRDATADAAREVRDGLDEVERTVADIEEKIPDAVREFSRKLGDLIKESAAHGRGRTREDRREMRDAIRRAAHEMSESIREAAQAARGGNVRRDESGPSGDEARARASTQPLSREAHQRDIMAILTAVKAGEIEPEEADEMIAALTEAQNAV